MRDKPSFDDLEPPFGAVFGAVILVVTGCAILFAKLLAQRRDEEALEHAQWILLPEWYLVEKLPVWLLALLVCVGLAVVIAFLGALVIGTAAASR